MALSNAREVLQGIANSTILKSRADKDHLKRELLSYFSNSESELNIFKLINNGHSELANKIIVMIFDDKIFTEIFQVSLKNRDRVLHVSLKNSDKVLQEQTEKKLAEKERIEKELAEKEQAEKERIEKEKQANKDIDLVNRINEATTEYVNKLKQIQQECEASYVIHDEIKVIINDIDNEINQLQICIDKLPPNSQTIQELTNIIYNKQRAKNDQIRRYKHDILRITEDLIPPVEYHAPGSIFNNQDPVIYEALMKELTPYITTQDNKIIMDYTSFTMETLKKLYQICNNDKLNEYIKKESRCLPIIATLMSFIGYVPYTRSPHDLKTIKFIRLNHKIQRFYYQNSSGDLTGFTNNINAV